MSEAIFELDAEIRADKGKGASRRLRRAEAVPAVLYGGSEPAVSLTLDHNKVINALDHEAFYSHILTLNIEGKQVQTVLKDVQRHPYKPKALHLDFMRVDAKQELTTNIPLHFINEAKAPAIKDQGGHAEHHIVDVEISCLPGDLPEFIEVDLIAVEMDQTLHLSDLVVPKGVTLVELAKGEDHDQAVVTIKAAKGGSDADDASDDAADAEEATEE